MDEQEFLEKRVKFCKGNSDSNRKCSKECPVRIIVEKRRLSCGMFFDRCRKEAASIIGRWCEENDCKE